MLNEFGGIVIGTIIAFVFALLLEELLMYFKIHL